MRLTFLGATRTVTGSRYLLELNGCRLLLECGLFQGHRKEAFMRNRSLPFDCAGIDHVLLSHAHIDHSGVIPVLCNSGFAGKIHCTDATADLCRVMLPDSGRIQEQDAAFVSKKQAKKGLPPVEPVYTQAEAEAALAFFQPVAYNQPVSIADGVTATWLEAGHILGSAMIALELRERGRLVRFAFSGDIGRGHNDILRDPDHPREVDHLMMEATYGNRVHEPLKDLHAHLCAIINRAADGNGKIIIPAFAVGRTQQLLHTLYQLTASGCIPLLPIYVDSPLSAQATEVFRRHPECFNQKFYRLMMNRHTPFSMVNLTYIGSVEESIALNDRREPSIIVSASGMAEAGRVQHHIKNNIGDPRNTILIVGWCAPHTLAARLASGHNQVNIFGEPYRVRARVETINAFSGHADKTELREWVSQVTGPMRGIYLVHAEHPPATAFAEVLRGMHPRANVQAPAYGESGEF
jgi:metallo-beta-lactamase family protein